MNSADGRLRNMLDRRQFTHSHTQHSSGALECILDGGEAPNVTERCEMPHQCRPPPLTLLRLRVLRGPPQTFSSLEANSVVSLRELKWPPQVLVWHRMRRWRCPPWPRAILRRSPHQAHRIHHQPRRLPCHPCPTTRDERPRRARWGEWVPRRRLPPRRHSRRLRHSRRWPLSEMPSIAACRRMLT